jgi:carboxypeptidase D
MVRQYGNFSFTRVFQAGHEVPAYQPETAYEIFRRAMNNLDIATGTKSTIPQAGSQDVYATQGDPDTWAIKLEPPAEPEPMCYLLSLQSTCSKDQVQAVLDGSVTVQNYIVAGTNGKSGSSKTSGAAAPKKSSMASSRLSLGKAGWSLSSGFAFVMVAVGWLVG